LCAFVSAGAHFYHWKHPGAAKAGWESHQSAAPNHLKPLSVKDAPPFLSVQQCSYSSSPKLLTASVAHSLAAAAVKTKQEVISSGGKSRRLPACSRSPGRSSRSNAAESRVHDACPHVQAKREASKRTRLPPVGARALGSRHPPMADRAHDATRRPKMHGGSSIRHARRPTFVLELRGDWMEQESASLDLSPAPLDRLLCLGTSSHAVSTQRQSHTPYACAGSPGTEHRAPTHTRG
jgi:hypothetical protein